MRRKITNLIKETFPNAEVGEVRSDASHAYIRIGNVDSETVPQVGVALFKKFSNLACLTFIDNETMADYYFTRRMFVYEGYLGK